jgi:hypothetical protein
MSCGRRALLVVACMFMESQILVRDGISLDLLMV